MSTTAYGPSYGPPAEPPPPSSQPPASSLPPLGPARRNGRVVLLRVVGIFSVLALLAAGSGSLVIQFFQQNRTDKSSISEVVTRVVAGTDTGDIRIRTGAAGSPVLVSRKLQWSFQEPVVKLEPVVDGVLTLVGDCVGTFWQHASCSTDFEITVPAGTVLDLETGVGDIRADGTSGAVVAESGSGDIAVDAPGAMSVQVKSGVGDVTVTGGGEGARIHGETGSGDLTLALRAAPAEVKAETGVGDVKVTVPGGLPYRVTTDSGVGDKSVKIPQDPAAPRQISATTGTGDIEVRPAS